MARVRQSGEIGSREARRRLKARAEPYWRNIERGLFVGYRKTAQGGAWIARRYDPKAGKYSETRVATADDYRDADGVDVLDFGQAQRKVQDESQKGALKASGKTYTVREAAADYVDWLRLHRKTAPNTEAKLRAYVLPRIGDSRVAELTAAELEEWRVWALERKHKPKTKLAAKKRNFKTPRPPKPEPPAKVVDKAEAARKRKSTVNRVINALKACLNHAHKNGKVATRDAWAKLDKFRNADTSRKRWLSEDEAERLQNACAPALRQIVRAALLTGCRMGELLALRVGDYDARSNSLHIADSKSGKPRDVLLTNAGAAHFESVTAGKAADARMFARSDGSAWYAVALQRAIDAACDAAKLAQRATFHSLRHTFASHLAQQGTPLLYIAHALGHGDTRMVEKHYGHFAREHVREVLNAKLPSFGPMPETNVTKLKPPKKRARK